MLGLPYRVFPECGGGYNGSSGEVGRRLLNYAAPQFHKLKPAVIEFNQ